MGTSKLDTALDKDCYVELLTNSELFKGNSTDKAFVAEEPGGNVKASDENRILSLWLKLQEYCESGPCNGGSGSNASVEFTLLLQFHI